MKKIRILIADDHNIVRTGLKLLLRSAKDFSIVGEASNGEEVLSLVRKCNPDVAILDISMPKLNGIEATRRIRQDDSSTKILILTIYENEEYVYQMLHAGANGYVLKNANKEELLNAVRTVAAGDRFFSPGISDLMIDEFIKRAGQQEKKKDKGNDTLTKREEEILRYIAGGLTNLQIAEKLFLSVRTVDTHRTNLMHKLDIHDTAGLVRYAIESGMLILHKKSGENL